MMRFVYDIISFAFFIIIAAAIALNFFGAEYISQHFTSMAIWMLIFAVAAFLTVRMSCRLPDLGKSAARKSLVVNLIFIPLAIYSLYTTVPALAYVMLPVLPPAIIVFPFFIFFRDINFLKQRAMKNQFMLWMFQFIALSSAFLPEGEGVFGRGLSAPAMASFLASYIMLLFMAFYVILDIRLAFFEKQEA